MDFSLVQGQRYTHFFRCDTSLDVPQRVMSRISLLLVTNCVLCILTDGLSCIQGHSQGMFCLYLLIFRVFGCNLEDISMGNIQK